MYVTSCDAIIDKHFRPLKVEGQLPPWRKGVLKDQSDRGVISRQHAVDGAWHAEASKVFTDIFEKFVV